MLEVKWLFVCDVTRIFKNRVQKKLNLDFERYIHTHEIVPFRHITEFFSYLGKQLTFELFLIQ
jgi:hypothetical protein